MCKVMPVPAANWRTRVSVKESGRNRKIRERHMSNFPGGWCVNIGEKKEGFNNLEMNAQKWQINNVRVLYFIPRREYWEDTYAKVCKPTHNSLGCTCDAHFFFSTLPVSGHLTQSQCANTVSGVSLVLGKTTVWAIVFYPAVSLPISWKIGLCSCDWRELRSAFGSWK